MKDFARPRRASLRIVLALVACLGVSASLAAEPAAAPGPPGTDGTKTAAYQLTLAKLLESEGDLPGSLAAYEEAVRLSPEAPYVRMEYGLTLLRSAQAARPGIERVAALQKAAAQVGRAREMAPENPDALRAVAMVYLELATRDPQALEVVEDALAGVCRADPSDFQAAFTLARVYLERNKADKAATLLSGLIAREPQQLPAYSLLAEALVRSEKPREAEEVLARYLEIDPSVLEARLMLAELQDRRGDFAASVATLRKVPFGAQADPRLRRQLARALYFTGDLEGARASLAPLLASSADDPQLLLLSALVAQADGRADQAVAAFRNLAAQRPDDPSVAVALARALVNDGKRDEAIGRLGELADGQARQGKGKEATQIRLERAQILLDSGDWRRLDEALPALHAAASEPGASPELALAVKSLEADSLLSRERYADAAALLADAAGSTAPVALVAKRAEALARAGRTGEADAALSELAGRGDPQSVLAAVQAYQRLERYADSIPLLTRLPREKPAALWIGFLLGSAYERSGRHDEAVTEFRRALTEDPDYAPALNYLGYLFAERREHLDEARQLTERAVALDPDNGAYVDSLGWVYFQLGRKPEARALLERAVRLDPEDASVREHLGDVLSSLGEIAQARAAYESALSLAKDDRAKSTSVQRKLESLRRGAPGVPGR
jgi:tetratricopeptide (TPR) repeat protein